VSIVALDPTGGPPPASRVRRLAARPAALDGARLGLVVNGLGTLIDLAWVVKVVKAGVSVPPDPGDWSRLTEGATVAITGFGG
jgi:hypothetical protein